MPRVPTHHVQPVDELAAQFKEFHKRINSLERASTSGTGGGGGTPPLSSTTAPLNPNTPAAGGVSTDASRGDHVHDLPNWSGAPWEQTLFDMPSRPGTMELFARGDHAHGTPKHDAAAHSTIPINSLAVATGPINMGGFTIQSVGTPVNPNDAANKSYVDNMVAGLSWKDSVRCHSANANNNFLAALGIYDGVQLVDGDRILLKDQSTPTNNGIWVAHSGAWVRATDADTGTEMLGAAVFVEEGTTGADTAWVCTTNAPITLGTTALTFAQFSGGGAITAGTGLTQSGNVINVGAGAGIFLTADTVGLDYLAPGAPLGVSDKPARYDHTHDWTTLTGMTEGAQDAVGAMVDTTLVYNDASNLLSRAALTGDVTAAAGANATTITNDAVTNAKLANMPTNTVKANLTGATADPADVTIQALATALGPYSSTGADEVFVGPNDPGTTGTYELWVDSDEASPAALPVAEIFHSQITAGVTISASTSSTAQTVINPGNVTYDGTPIVLELFLPGVQPPTTTNAQILIDLWDGNTDLGYVAQVMIPVSGNYLSVPVHSAMRLTPTPGVHNYNVRAWVSPAAAGSGTINVGPGGVSAFAPGFLRATRVLQGGAAISPPAGGLEANRPVAAPALAGLRYFATDTLRDWLCDGTGWIVMSEPVITSFVPVFTAAGITTALNGFSYQRSNGWVEWTYDLSITGGNASPNPTTFTLPLAAADLVAIGVGESSAVMMYVRSAVASTTATVFKYDSQPAQLYSPLRLGFSGRYRMTSRYT